MVHGIGAVSGIVVVIIIVVVVNDDCISVITSITMVIGMMANIDTHRHHRVWRIIGRIVAIIIRRIIGHINGGIHVLYNGC